MKDVIPRKEAAESVRQWVAHHESACEIAVLNFIGIMLGLWLGNYGWAELQALAGVGFFAVMWVITVRWRRAMVKREGL